MSTRLAGAASTKKKATLWADIPDKPSAFPPSGHRHVWSDIDDKPAVFPTDWANVGGKPSAFNPAPHDHTIAQINGLANALAAKATPADITNALNSLINGAPAAYDTLKEIADKFDASDSDHAAFLSALAMRLRVDGAQSLTTQQQAFGRSNLGLGAAATRDDSYFALASTVITLATNAGLAATTNGSVGTSLRAAREDHTHPAPKNGNKLLGQFNVAETGLTLLALSVRKVPVAAAGAVIGGNYMCFPVNALPAGFGIVDSICTAANQLSVGMLVPVITGAYTIPVRVVEIQTG